MKLKKLFFKNILSFEKLSINIEDVNLIVGPNNTGKTNIIRILKFLKQQMGDDRNIEINEIFRDNNKFKPFRIEVELTLQLEDIKKINNFLKITGEYNIVKEIKEGALPNFLHDNGIENIYKNIEGQDKYEMALSDLSQLFKHIWLNSYQKIKTLLFIRNKYKLIMEYDGNYPKWPNIYFELGNGKYILDSNAIFHNKSQRSRRNYLIGKVVSQVFFKDNDLMDHLRKLLEEYISTGRNIKSISKDLIKTFRCSIVKYIEDPSNKFIIKFDFRDSTSDDNYIYAKEFMEYFPEFGILNDRQQGNKSLYGLLIQWFKENLILTDENRMHLDRNSLEDYGIYDYSSYYLPSILYALKNSGEKEDIIRYKKIQNKFFTITGHNFEVFSKFPSVSSNTGENKIIMNTDNIQIKIYPTNVFSHSMKFAGSGLYELLYILTLIVGVKNKYIFLDEPALNLHPTWQKIIINNLINYSENNQFIIITHSPYILPNFEDYLIETKENINIRNGKIRMYHFSRNQNKTEEHLINIDPLDKKCLRLFEMKKQIFFTNINIIIEGQSDEYILLKISEGIISKEELQTKNIEFIKADGSSLSSLFRNLNKWRMPVATIIDYDNIKKYNDFSNDMKKNTLLLPSDIEGTIVLGNILWNIKLLYEINELKYQPRDYIKTFSKINSIFPYKRNYIIDNILKGFNRKKCNKKETQNVIAQLYKVWFEKPKPVNQIDKIIDALEKYKNETSNHLLIELFDVFVVNSKQFTYKLSRVEKEILNNNVDIVLNKLIYYKEKKLYDRNKVKRSLEIVNYDLFFKYIPKELHTFLGKFLNMNNDEP